MQKIKIQLWPSPRSSKGQILRGRPETARGRQALKRRLIQDQATSDRLCRWFPAHLRGLRSTEPIGTSVSFALESKPGRIRPERTKPGSVFIKFPNVLRNSASRRALSAVPALAQAPCPALVLTTDCVFEMGLLRGVVDKLDLAQPPRRLGPLGGVVTFLRSRGCARQPSPLARGGPCPHLPRSLSSLGAGGSELPLRKAS